MNTEDLKTLTLELIELTKLDEIIWMTSGNQRYETKDADGFDLIFDRQNNIESENQECYLHWNGNDYLYLKTDEEFHLINDLLNFLAKTNN